MNQKNWQRARSSEQREIRTREILGAAEKLFISRPYEKITMQMIAREASLSQSNLYRYFTTREEIFLKIFLTDLENLTKQVETEFTREITADKFVSRLTDLLMKQERFLHLSPLLAVTLEKNCSEEVYRSVKLAIAELTGRNRCGGEQGSSRSLAGTDQRLHLFSAGTDCGSTADDRFQ